MSSRRAALAALALAGVVLFAFAGALDNGFVDIDDLDYVLENRHVAGGLSVEGMVWAWTSFHAANWHPLTWLSHMTDVTLFGLEPRGHHATSVVLHAAATVLLFFALRSMTGRTGCAWVAAALFGVHPLRVESVAWIAERKDVLSTCCAMAALVVYSAQVKRPSRGRKAALVALYAAGLLAKPMLVTLPFALLLLDAWPLRRFDLATLVGGGSGEARRRERRSFGALVREKLPLFVLSGASCVVTFLAQSRGGAVIPLETIPLGMRVANAAVACVTYLAQGLWPSGLAFFYPHAAHVGGDGLAPWRVASAVAIVAVLSLVVARLARSRPGLAVGWLWYLGLLAPVLGLVQVGIQSHADRYTYLPLVGPTIVVVWGGAAIAGRFGTVGRWLSGGAAALAIVGLTVATRAQVKTWREPLSLVGHALAVTQRNQVAHNNLGVYLAKQGKVAEATTHFEESARLAPGYAPARDNLGTAMMKRGDLPAAIAQYEMAESLAPDNAPIRVNLALALVAVGRHAEALAHLQEAVRLKPGYAKARYNLGMALARQGGFDAALEQLDAALDIDPGYADAWGNRGLLLSIMGRRREAADDYRRALALRPDWAEVRGALDALEE